MKFFRVFGFFNFKKPTYFLTDIELIKKITIKDFDHFVNHDLFTNVDRIFDRSLFALHDKEWRDMRTTLSPIFTSSKMKMMFGLLSNQAQDFVNFYEARASKGEKLIIDVLDVFARFTADGISTSVLGFEADCVRNEESDVFKMAKKILHDFNGPLGNLKFIFAFALPKFYKFLRIQCASKEVHDFFHHTVVDAMNERDRKNISRPDVIQLLLQAKKGQLQSTAKENEINEKELSNFSANIEYDLGGSKSKSQFDDFDWIAQGFIFFGAGFDTTSNLLQQLSFELARNSDVQRELQDEIDSVLADLDGEAISYEALHKMKYLDMVISETLRKWPPAPQTDRTCSKDYNIDLGNGKKITIQKGQTVFLPIYHIQHDPNYFPDPEKFDPNRFSDENKNSIIPGSYLPFGKISF
jgi:cytochrome P450 family 9